jgi:nitroreductase
LSEESLETILGAARMAPTSFGLQPFHIHVVTDQEIRKRIQDAAFGQPQVVEASHLFVFSARADVASRVDAYVDLVSEGGTDAKAKLSGMADMMKQFASRFDEAGALSWAAKQTYIALGFAMAAAAELEIDSCPMEGFSPSDVDTILGLPAHMKSVALLAVGYRAEEPSFEKTRFPEGDLFTRIG